MISAEEMTFLIVDSEREDRETLCRQISGLLPSFRYVEACSVTEAREAILRGGIDGVFIDPSLRCGDGLEFLKELSAMEIAVVVISATDGHALAAFDHAAEDYLLKPVGQTRLIKAVSRVGRKVGKPAEGLVMFSDQNHCWPVPLKDLIMAEGEGSYVTIHIRDRKPIVICRTLKEVETLLGPQEYIRVNRRQIVRLRSVISIRRGDASGFSAEVEGCGVIAFSRRQAQAFRQRFGV